jgi:hypothetical protein
MAAALLSRLLMTIGGILASALVMACDLVFRDQGPFNHGWRLPGFPVEFSDHQLAWIAAAVGCLGLYLVRVGFRISPHRRKRTVSEPSPGPTPAPPAATPDP